MRKSYLIAAVLATGALMPLHSPPVRAASSRVPATNVTGDNQRLNYKNVTELNVYGNGCTIVISGRCKTLNVIGDRNTIIVQRCDAMTLYGNFNRITPKVIQNVSAIGNDNKVTWRDSVDKNGPNISSLGSRNSIVRARG